MPCLRRFDWPRRESGRVASLRHVRPLFKAERCVPTTKHGQSGHLFRARRDTGRAFGRLPNVHQIDPANARGRRPGAAPSARPVPESPVTDRRRRECAFTRRAMCIRITPECWCSHYVPRSQVHLPEVPSRVPLSPRRQSSSQKHKASANPGPRSTKPVPILVPEVQSQCQPSSEALRRNSGVAARVRLCAVPSIGRCTFVCALHFRLWAVLPIVRCTFDCALDFRLCPVLSTVRHALDCASHFRLRGMLSIARSPFDCALYFGLCAVGSIVLCTFDCAL
jgi:hypothetical protein